MPIPKFLKISAIAIYTHRYIYPYNPVGGYSPAVRIPITITDSVYTTSRFLSYRCETYGL